MAVRENLVRQFIETLRKLLSKPIQESESSTEDLLYRAFDIGVAKVEFSSEEALTVGAYLREALPSVDRCIYRKATFFESCYAPNNQVLRSGLQFIVDDYKHLPVDAGSGETLEKSLEALKEEGNVDDLDARFRSWKSDSGIAEDAFVTPETIRRPAGVPLSHFWWF